MGKRIAVLNVLLALFLLGCAVETKNAAEPNRFAGIDQDVRRMIDNLSDDLSQNGPGAWTEYFVDGPEFYMISDGKLLFPTIGEAKKFIGEFAPTVSTMSLTWSDVRIDPVDEGLAVVAAAYREVIVETSGTEKEFGGYLSGVVTETPSGWRFRTLHWSSPGGNE